MGKHIGVNQELYNDKVLDKKGNVISLKKRVNDSKVITHLLSSKSNHKLSLKQYKFLMAVRVKDKITPSQRDWLEDMYKKS